MSGKEFMDIYLPLGERMYRVAFYLLGTEQDAEDAVQDLYVKLWNSMQSLDNVHNPEAYCITLVRNICLDRLKRKENRARGELAGDVADVCDTAEVVIHRERLARALKAMEGLSEGQRKVLKMRIFDNMSYEDISNETGYSHLTLRVMLSQARKKIRRCYENE